LKAKIRPICRPSLGTKAKKAAVLLGTLVLISPASVGSEPLYIHLRESVEVDLANDVPIRLPLRTDLSQILKKHDQITCFDCYEEPLVHLELLSLSLHKDFAISLFDSFE
jgi:hypothetical protein